MPAAGWWGTCSSGPPIELSPAYQELSPGPYRKDIWWRSVAQGTRSGIGSYGYRVIRNPTDLATYWRQHAGPEALPWDPDRFDWDREQLFAIHLGKMPSSGYEMVLDSIERSGIATITVRYTVVYPALPQPFGASPSSPYALIRMDKLPDRFIMVRRNFLPSANGDYGCNCRCGRCRDHR